MEAHGLEKISYGKLFLAIFAALLLAAVVVLIGVRIWTYYELKAIAEAAEKELKVQAAIADAKLQAQQMLQKQRAEEARRQAEIKARQAEELARKRRIEQERLSNAQRINRETCRTWTEAYQKDKSDRSRVMMENACRRAGSG